MGFHINLIPECDSGVRPSGTLICLLILLLIRINMFQTELGLIESYFWLPSYLSLSLPPPPLLPLPFFLSSLFFAK